MLNSGSMWSLYVGRPWGMNSRDISVSRPPREIDSIRKKLWTPYGNGREGPNDANQLSLFDPVEACADANASLAEIMSRISRTL